MELLAIVFVVGALFIGFRAGAESGRTQLLDAQSQGISSALGTENEFYRKTGLHGSFLLEGHEYRSPSGYVIVSYNDLTHLIAVRVPQAAVGAA